MAFDSLRAYLAHLEKRELVYVIKRPVNKDTELMPLVRCQYRGLEEDERRAFLFTQVTDARNRSYPSPVLVAALGASRRIYAAALGCGVDELKQKWIQAVEHLIEPVMAADGAPPVHEKVIQGAELEEAGLDRLPIPISTPGFDVAPFITCSHWVTKDPDTGVVNIGNYRAMVKAPDKVGIQLHPTQHVGIHWTKQKERGRPLEAAVVIGAPPTVAMAAVAKVPYGMNEYAVAGGLLGRPIELVPCRTVGLEVPAHAEIVLEGEITTSEKEPEAPFGEFSGYMGKRAFHPYFRIKCITHRERPIYQAFISQFPPSESSKIRSIANEATYFNILRNRCNVPAVTDIVFHEAGGGQNLIVIQMNKRHASETWQALNIAASLDSTYGKIMVAVDDDIDPNSLDAVVWALTYRMQPGRDLQLIQGQSSVLDPSSAPPDTPEPQQFYPGVRGNSAMLMDATRKWDYPPVSLPKQPYMERAMEIWQEEGLPPLNLRQPWHGYLLGPWPAEFAAEAELAVKGEYYETGRKLAGQRVALEPADS